MILITGLTGTSGKPFYDVLCREQYNEKIRVVVRETTDTSQFDGSPLDLELVTGDVTDVEFMKKALEGCDTVFHIAIKNHSHLVMEAVKQSPQIKRVILVSSTIVYSEFYKTLDLKEREVEIRQLLEERNIRYVFIRPTMIFGTPHDRNISVFIRWFMKYPLFPIVKNGTANIQPVSRYDLAEAYWLILKNLDNLKQTEYIVSGKDCMSLLEMFRLLTDLIGKKVRFINIPFGIASAAVKAVYYLSFKKVDFREKLDRLTEDRAYPHDVIAEELGYSPHPFVYHAKTLVAEMQKNK
ncbi:MAG: NAD(P)H-binding protein [Clostridia bacterium]|nr:NAD(P)H-binding protein [Clostridia bacterium]